MSVDDPRWTLTPEEVVALPLDELALRVLKSVRDTNQWHEHNWMNAAYNSLTWSREAEAQHALSEAFGWLRSHVLIARKPGGTEPLAIFVTRRGHATLDKGLAWLRATARLDIDLVPELERAARPQVLRGDTELAAFAAMREVEIAVRKASGLPDNLIGVKLMQEAFKAGGPLHDPDMEAGESVAAMNLYMGALGLFKNPSSHRQVNFDDPIEAIEIILLADLLLRLLAKRTA